MPFRTQGRVFGFAQSVELAASPISAFLIGPIAEFALIPYMESAEGRETWRWLVGDGDARGIALVFIAAGRDHVRHRAGRARLRALPPAVECVRRRPTAAARGCRRRLTAASGRHPRPQEAHRAVHRGDEGRAERVPVVVPLQGRVDAGPVSARWVARAHGGGQVSSKRPCTISTGSVMSAKSGRGETPFQKAGSSAGRPCRPRKPAFSSASGASGRWNCAKFSASRLDTDAQPTPAANSPGSATSAFIITPPPIDRPKSAMRSGSTRTSSEPLSARAAAIVSAA